MIGANQTGFEQNYYMYVSCDSRATSALQQSYYINVFPNKNLKILLIIAKQKVTDLLNLQLLKEFNFPLTFCFATITEKKRRNK